MLSALGSPAAAALLRGLANAAAPSTPATAGATAMDHMQREALKRLQFDHLLQAQALVGSGVPAPSIPGNQQPQPPPSR